jgi:hypothetical protein
VNRSLPYFRQKCITRLLSASYFCRLYLLIVHAVSCLSPPSPVESVASQLLLQALFTESLHGEQLLDPHPFSSVLNASRPLCCMSFSVPCLLFSVLVFFFEGWGSVCPGDYAGLFQGWPWEYRVLLICSPFGLRLPSRFGAGVWWRRSPRVFSV